LFNQPIVSGDYYSLDMSSNDQNKSLVIQEFGLVTFYHILPEN